MRNCRIPHLNQVTLCPLPSLQQLSQLSQPKSGCFSPPSFLHGITFPDTPLWVHSVHPQCNDVGHIQAPAMPSPQAMHLACSHATSQLYTQLCHEGDTAHSAGRVLSVIIEVRSRVHGTALLPDYQQPR